MVKDTTRILISITGSFFDLKKDPHEVNNVYDAPAYAAVREQLTKDLARLREEVQATE